LPLRLRGCHRPSSRRLSLSSTRLYFFSYFLMFRFLSSIGQRFFDFSQVPRLPAVRHFRPSFSSAWHPHPLALLLSDMGLRLYQKHEPLLRYTSFPLVFPPFVGPLSRIAPPFIGPGEVSFFFLAVRSGTISVSFFLKRSFRAGFPLILSSFESFFPLRAQRNGPTEASVLGGICNSTSCFPLRRPADHDRFFVSTISRLHRARPRTYSLPA